MDVRLDSFNNFNHPHMARGSFMYGGMAVVVSPNVPKFHAGDEIVPVMPWWAFAYRWFNGCDPVPVRYRPGNKIEHEQAFEIGGKLYVPPAMWQEICRQSQNNANTVI